jgi:energy-coupling factor transport system permease protein
VKQMPTGQYIPGHSVLHRLDARAKLLCLLILLAAVVAAGSPAGYAAVSAAVFLAVLLSGLPLRLAVGAVTRMWLLFVTTFAMNALFFNGAGEIWSWGIFHVTGAGIRQGAEIVVHMVLILILSTVMTMTTSPLEITSALETLIRPLRFLGVPTEDVAMIISVAIQFIPTLLEETDTIRKAQIARGARFESRRMLERAASFLPLVVPIFLSAFRRADELSVAMEARGYRNARGRTARDRRALCWPDYAAFTASMAVCVIQMLM